MTIKRLSELFDEKAEVVGWITITAALVLFLAGKFDSTAFLAMWGTGVASFLGAKLANRGGADE